MCAAAGSSSCAVPKACTKSFVHCGWDSLGAIGIVEACGRCAGAVEFFLASGTANDVVAGLLAHDVDFTSDVGSAVDSDLSNSEPFVAALLAAAISLSFGHDKGNVIGGCGVAAVAVAILDKAPSARLRILAAMLLQVQCLDNECMRRVVRCNGGAALTKLVDDEALPTKVKLLRLSGA
jgi:hypothetical protein